MKDLSSMSREFTFNLEQQMHHLSEAQKDEIIEDLYNQIGRTKKKVFEESELLKR